VKSRAALRRSERELPPVRGHGASPRSRDRSGAAQAGADAGAIFIPHLLPLSPGWSARYVRDGRSAARRSLRRARMGRGRSSCCAAEPPDHRSSRDEPMRDRLALGRRPATPS
jgi:hypothetical protein